MVCLSVTFVHSAQTTEDIDVTFLRTTISFLIQKIWLTSVNFFLQILAQSDPPPVDLIVGDIRWQIAAEWLEIAQCSQFESLQETIITLSNGTIADPLRSLPQI